MLPFAINGPLRKTDFAVPGFLVKVAFLDSLKTAGTLVHHIVDGAYVAEIETVYAATF